ncbi:serine hydrolase [Solibacillus silvestris]|uniref:serine hydrolase n=1 Tax=Solibacillus silvestris TaxID=76853 RepID=UPI003F7F5AEA
MNSWAWIGLSSIIFFTLLPFVNKKNRTKAEMQKAIVTVGTVIGIIIAVSFFHVNYIAALLFGLLAVILLDRKTYTKKRLSIYGLMVLAVGIAAFAVFRDNPDYVLKHLKENPQSSSLFVAENGMPFIAYHSDVVRPLASTVKILIAVEYAMQVDANTIQKNDTVSLEELNRFYLKNSDGGAHEAWLNIMKSDGKIKNNEVSLHDVAKGMITYSSNANTDFLIGKLGINSINERAKALGIEKHEEVYPIVSALFIPEHVQQEDIDEKELIKILERMPIDEYRSLSTMLSQHMKTGMIKTTDATFNLSPALQKVWSDRLIGASANDYGKLLAIISNDELPNVAAETIRDLLEWPMQLNQDNQKHFAYIGAKGGSTMFILNNAMYAQNLNGDQYELVLLMDDLNIMEQLLISNNRHSFESKLLNSKDYRMKVLNELAE